MIDLFGIFKDYAATKGWRSIYTSIGTKEWQTTQQDLTGGENILWVFPFDEVPVKNNNIGIVDHWTASTQIWLGRKFDNTATTGTMSSIDETAEQKYDRRIKVLRDHMRTLFNDLFICGDYEYTQFRITTDFNQTNESIDFVVATVTFKHNG